MSLGIVHVFLGILEIKWTSDLKLISSQWQFASPSLVIECEQGILPKGRLNFPAFQSLTSAIALMVPFKPADMERKRRVGARKWPMGGPHHFCSHPIIWNFHHLATSSYREGWKLESIIASHVPRLNFTKIYEKNEYHESVNCLNHIMRITISQVLSTAKASFCRNSFIRAPPWSLKWLAS